MSAGQGSGLAPRIRVGRGARATEELLLADLDALLPASVADLGLLAKPVVVVVPSRSLRLHLASRLVERRGRAVAGVSIRTPVLGCDSWMRPSFSGESRSPLPLAL